MKLPSFASFRPLMLLTLVLICLLPASPAFGFLGKVLKKDTVTTDESAAAIAEQTPYTGVKHAVGVVGFENEASWRGQFDLGENLSMMLESALYESGRFIIVDRQELGTVMLEQDLQASGRAAESSKVAQTGLVRSARYIATGTVTRVDHNTSGETGGIGFRGIKIGGGSNRAEIEVVVKLIDSTTSQVVASKRISGVAGGRSLNLGIRRGGGSASLGGFAKTPVGEAAQDCIAQAATFIAEEMEDYDVTANVVMVRSPEEIIINRGEDFGVAVGQIFIVREPGEVLTDPATGEILDYFEGAETARVEITRVSEKVSYCKLADGTLPKRGDSLVFKAI